MFYVKATCSISDIGRQPSAIVRQAQRQGAVTVCRNGRAVAFLVSKDRMEAIIETLEVMANSEAMTAIRKYQGGELPMRDASCLDEK